MEGGFALNAVVVMGALTFMAASLYSDLRTRRIPNLLTVPFACGGILFHCVAFGLSGGGVYGLKGIMLGCSLLIIPFALGGMGGGDVKCLGALGAWMGPEQIFWIFLYGAMAGGLLSLFLLVRPSLEAGFRGLFSFFKTWSLTGRIPDAAAGNNRFPYTIPISAGLIGFALFGKVVP